MIHAYYHTAAALSDIDRAFERSLWELFASQCISDMDLDVFALDLLEAFSLILLVFPVFVELRERVPDIVYEKLWQLLVVLDNIAEEFTETVVDD